MRYAELLSFGAGVNSTALAIMAINDGWRGQIVFSDTGCEWPETYCCMDYFEREWLQPRGFEVVRLKGMPWQRHGSGKHKIPGCSLIEYCEAACVIPLAAMRWCTSEWKVKPMARFGDGRKAMIGISTDEAHRQGEAVRPLVDAGVDREGCIDIIEAEGMDVPQKSGCYICPFMGDHQWRMLWERHPELFERAMLMEERAQRGVIARQAKTPQEWLEWFSEKQIDDGEITITRSGKRWNATLDPDGKITLRQRKLAYESQMELPGIDRDDLLRYQPCICTL